MVEVGKWGLGVGVGEGLGGVGRGLDSWADDLKELARCLMNPCWVAWKILSEK